MLQAFISKSLVNGYYSPLILISTAKEVQLLSPFMDELRKVEKLA